MNLEGKVALVTGSSRGVGRAVALGFAQQGAKVVVNYTSNQGAADEVVSEIESMGTAAIAVKADVALKSDVELLVGKAVDAFGKLDILVNNAGFLRDRMFVNATEDEWDAVTRVHLKGHFCVARHAAAYWHSGCWKNERISAGSF